MLYFDCFDLDRSLVGNFLFSKYCFHLNNLHRCKTSIDWSQSLFEPMGLCLSCLRKGGHPRFYKQPTRAHALRQLVLWHITFQRRSAAVTKRSKIAVSVKTVRRTGHNFGVLKNSLQRILNRPDFSCHRQYTDHKHKTININAHFTAHHVIIDLQQRIIFLATVFEQHFFFFIHFRTCKIYFHFQNKLLKLSGFNNFMFQIILHILE